MTSAMARMLAVVALVATAACGGGGSDSVQEQTRPTGAEGSGTVRGTAEGDGAGTPTSEEERLASIFPGSDSQGGSASSIKLPRTEVGEPAEGRTRVAGVSGEKPKGLEGVRGEIDNAELVFIQKCLGEVPPEGCEVIFQVTPTEPGPYSGELTFTMDDGSTVTAPVSGEAVGAVTTTSAPPVEPTTTAPAPVTPTEVVPETEDVPTDVPTPDDEYELP
ncbi:hypothetical protein [Streptomyces sp. NPDC003635]